MRQVPLFAALVVGHFQEGAPRLAHVVHLAGGAEVLVAHLQHVQFRVVPPGLVDALQREEEVGQIFPVRRCSDIVGTHVVAGVAAVGGDRLARVGDDDHPHVVAVAPALQLRQQVLHVLRFVLVLRTVLEVDIHVGVDDEVVERALAEVAVGQLVDAVGRGELALQVDVRHVVVQEAQAVLAHSAGQVARVVGLQVKPRHLGVVFGFVGILEREEQAADVFLHHHVEHQVLQEGTLAAVGLTGDDDESPFVGGMKHVVGIGTVAHVVAVVVVPVQVVEDGVVQLGHGDNLVELGRMGVLEDMAHGLLAVAQQHFADVLAVGGVLHEAGVAAQKLGKLAHHGAAGQVGVAAEHYGIDRLEPAQEGLQVFLGVAVGSVGHADAVGEARLAQGHAVLFAFGEEELRHPFALQPFGGDAVDVEGRDAQGRMVGELHEVLREADRLVGIDGRQGVAAAGLVAEDASVHLEGVSQEGQEHFFLQRLAVGIAFRTVALDGELGVAQSQFDGGGQGDADRLQVVLHGTFRGVGGVRVGGEGEDFFLLLGCQGLEVGRQRQGVAVVEAELLAEVGTQGFRMAVVGFVALIRFVAVIHFVVVIRFVVVSVLR